MRERTSLMPMVMMEFIKENRSILGTDHIADLSNSKQSDTTIGFVVFVFIVKKQLYTFMERILTPFYLKKFIFNLKNVKKKKERKLPKFVVNFFSTKKSVTLKMNTLSFLGYIFFKYPSKYLNTS